ncbi:hypothetical protein RD02_20280 [Pectobacterium brasiliense]|nr:hypothetical protein RD02_20280 [Pectobacterium brasiliense]
MSNGRVAVFFRIGVRLAAGVGFLVRCGAQLAGSLCCRPRARSSASTVWPPSLAAEAPASALGQHQPQSRSRSFVTALKALPRPRPNPAALAVPGSQSQAPRSFPCSPSPPRAAPAGGLPA